MDPAIQVTLLWLLFAGTHIGLATGRIRGALVERLGEGGFTALFSLVAAVTYAIWIAEYAALRFSGAPGLALGAVPALRWPLVAAIVGGIMLVAAGAVGYPDSPYDLFGHRIRSPRGIERITRHPFFAGVALAALAHALLATLLVGTVFAAGLALLAIAGARHQDAKYLARRGQAYREYVEATSAVPFAAVLSGRQQLVWRELPVGALAAGLAASVALRAVHGQIFAQGGLWVIVSVVGLAGVLTLVSWRRVKRASGRSVSEAA